MNFLAILDCVLWVISTSKNWLTSCTLIQKIYKCSRCTVHAFPFCKQAKEFLSVYFYSRGPFKILVW